MDDALLRSADAEAQAVGIYARDVLFDAADGNGAEPRGARADFQNDQRRDPALLFVGLSALGYRFALDDLRLAVSFRGCEAQHPWRQRQTRLRSRAGDVGSEA